MYSLWSIMSKNRAMKSVFTLACVFFCFFLVVSGQSSPCGTLSLPQPSNQRQQALQYANARISAILPIKVHIIRTNSGSTNVQYSNVQSQIALKATLASQVKKSYLPKKNHLIWRFLASMIPIQEYLRKLKPKYQWANRNHIWIWTKQRKGLRGKLKKIKVSWECVIV